MKRKFQKMLERLMELVTGGAQPAAIGLLIALQIAPLPIFAAVQPDRLSQKPKARIGAGVAQDSDFGFDVGLGSSNPTFKYKLSDQSLEFNKSILRFGSGTGANQTFEANVGAGANNPKLRYNYTNSEWEFSNDGTTYDGIGSGGGGGGGGGVNLLTSDDDPGFEDGGSVWTASGGSYTQDTSTPLFGTSSGVFDASALNQTLSSPSKLISSQGGLASGNCLAMIGYKYSGTSGDYTLQVYDGTSVLAEQSLNQATSFGLGYVGFTCPSSGSVLVRVLAAVSNPGAITVDGAPLSGGLVQLGSNVMLAQIKGSEFYGSLNYAKTANCSWQKGTGTAMSGFSADTDCPTPTVTGKLSAPGTKIPAFVMTNAPAGEYYVVTTGSFFNSGGNSSVQLSDGTTSSSAQPLSTQNTANSDYFQQVVGHFSYSASGTRTIEVQAYTNANAGINIYTDTSEVGNPLEFKVYYFPPTSQSVISGLEGMAQGWSGYHSGECDFVYSSAGSYADSATSTQSACSLVQRTNRNMGSVTGYGATTGTSAKDGIIFTPSKTGRYRVCRNGSFITNTGGTVGNSLRLVDGSGTVLGVGSSQFVSTTLNPVPICGDLDVTSVGSSVTVKLQAKLGAGTMTTRNAYTPGGPGTATDAVAEWSILYLDSGFPMPYLTNMITSSGSTERVQRAIFGGANISTNCTSSPCTILSQSGSWLSSVARTAAGQYTLTIASGIFSEIPACQVSCADGTVSIIGRTSHMHNPATWTSTSVKVLATDYSFAAADSVCNVTCTGPH